MPNIRQSSFATGEVSKNYYGATENPRYLSALRTCKNWLPIQHGALVNRPGTQLAVIPGGNRPNFATATRQRSFVFSDAQSVVLIFVDGAVFFAQAGELVDTAAGSGVALSVATTYAAADLPRLDFAQSGDVVEIRHPNYARQRLARTGVRSWTLSLTPLGPPAGFVPASVAMAPNGFGGDNATAYNAAAAYASGSYVNDGANSYICISPNGPSAPKAPAANPTFWALAVDAAHAPRSWSWVVTAKYRDANGALLETLPTPIPASAFTVLSDDRPNIINFTAPAAPGGGFVYVLVAFGIYRGRNGLYGWLDDAAPTATSYKDDGHEPDYDIQPPMGTNPFLVADGNDSAATVKNPGVVAFHEQRLVEARSDAKPNHFLGSWINDFTRWDKNLVQQLENNAYDHGISDGRLQEIRALVSMRSLLILAGDAEWSAEGAPGQAITPTSIRLVRHSRHGSSYLRPLVAGNTALFNTAKGNYVRDLVYSFQSGTYESSDLTVMARHLFEGFTITDWCLCVVPYPIIWAVRSDGLLLSCTYDRERQVVAWAQHPQDVGAIESVCAVPEGTEDVLYLVRALPSGRVLERMASRLVQDVRYCVFLDSSVEFDGHNTGGTTMQVSGATYGPLDAVAIVASAASFVPGTGSSDIGDEIVLCPDGLPAVLDDKGNILTPAIGPMRITIQAVADATHATGVLQNSLDVSFQNLATASWAWARDTIGALGHLVGQQVTVLADGGVQGPFTVDGSGSIGPLSPPAVVAQAGLQYDADLEMMDLAPSQVRANVKSVAKAVWEVVDTAGGLQAGRDFGHLNRAKYAGAQGSQAYEPLELVTDQVAIMVSDGWKTGARAVLRQPDPLPATVVAAIREVVIGGD